MFLIDFILEFIGQWLLDGGVARAADPEKRSQCGKLKSPGRFGVSWS
jgi:hypothetical protein